MKLIIIFEIMLNVFLLAKTCDFIRNIFDSKCHIEVLIIDSLRNISGRRRIKK